MSTQPFQASNPLPAGFSQLDPQRQKLILERAKLRADELEREALTEIQKATDALERRECETLKGFIQKAWTIVEPVQKLQWNWHLDVLCKEIESIVLGNEDVSSYTIINVPPGTMKSLLFVFLRAWLWTKKPHLRFLSASYSSGKSTNDNVKVRDIILSKWYKRLWPSVVFKGDQNAKERFENESKGYSFATSPGGGATGEHPDVVILDDIINEEESRSSKERKRVNDWVDRTMGARGQVRKVKVFLIMQRFHKEDPTGYLKQKGGWRHICFPMRYETKRESDPTYRPDALDIRRTPGELLWPSLYDETSVRKLEIKLGPYGASGQLQQNPVPEGKGLFKREWFKFVQALPKTTRRAVRGWDTAGTEDGGDYTVGVKLLESHNEHFIIAHVAREQVTPAGVDSLMKQTATLDGLECAQREEKEPADAGISVIEARRKLLKAFDYNFTKASVDKVTKCKPFRAQCEAGNVYIFVSGDPVRDSWVEPYLNELCEFPTGTNDDQVDGSSIAYNSLVREPIREEEFVTW